VQDHKEDEGLAAMGGSCVRMVFFVSIVALVLAAEQPTLAYLDPGSGSVALQVVLGGLGALGVLARLLWRGASARIARFFCRSGPAQGSAVDSDSTTR